MRKPTLAAGAANLLVHQARAEADRLLKLGAALREAHRTLDPQQLGRLSRRQHQVIAALARQAADLARRAGHPLSETVRHEVEQILHAVLADPEAADQWADGHLVKTPPTAVDFAALTPGTAVPTTQQPAPARIRARTPTGRQGPEPRGGAAPGAHRRRPYDGRRSGRGGAPTPGRGAAGRGSRP